MTRDYSEALSVFSVDRDTLNLSATGGQTEKIVITSNMSWSARVFPLSAREWIALSPDNQLNMSGKTDLCPVRLDISANGSGHSRKAQILVSASAGDMIITVIQE